MSDKFYLILAGGVGAAKFIEGLAHIINPKVLKIVVNTGDDLELYGLKICPDLDIITYTLANVVDKEKGWGFEKESFNCLDILKTYYSMEWFNLGDKDLATHLFRTDLMRRGFTKAETTKIICEKLGVESEIIPMCNEDVQSIIYTKMGKMHFEEYYIKYNCEPQVSRIEFKGIEEAKPPKNILQYINSAHKIFISPSNPIVSIGTILKVPEVRESLERVKKKVIGISPIIAGKTIKGPADKLMRTTGLEASCLGVANFYKDIMAHFVIDNKDITLKSDIEVLGIKPYCFDTIMTNLEKKKALGEFVLNLPID
ncbi:MAG: 2-phospho-L-lactate transferase [Candidatus Hermodarchaeota archaeon]